MEEPSRSRHGEGHARRVEFRSRRRVLPGYGELHARTVWFGTRETRLSSLVSKDRSYKPMVKSSGGQRESEGAVVVRIGVQRNAPGAKGPHFDRACIRSERQDMAARQMRPNYPGGQRPVVSAASEMVRRTTCPPVARARPRGRLWVAAKLPESPVLRANRFRWGDSPRAVRCRRVPAGCVAAPGRSSVSRVREGAADKAATQLVRVQPRQLSMSNVKRRHISVRVTARAMRGVQGLAARRGALRSEQPGGRASVGARR